ncbi:hypothetical protein acsn021_11880 [Anaerocolumna cellulosilytica]|uniref:Uncharacterized protein n=1 Tax=Anaerocolumna cellulosilytica TaxID=433286 RepID=A0A6S6QX46_9FIRM|nr:hypothetical protein [Anaerocolumna cellulosilytica]MBB5196076.1 hypothetical protein [Anaerocolumna cellulosilytica]BCJ93619.1 hypothetical protein acsn021_11880 [Anaerocolumna cellulosilytica]
MTEEVNNFNTDLKDLFVNNKFDELTEQLAKSEVAIIEEIIMHNYSIIKKYYEEEKFNLLVQYMRFVAYSSFLCEYGAKNSIIPSEEFDAMNLIFMNIHEYVTQIRNS